MKLRLTAKAERDGVGPAGSVLETPEDRVRYLVDSGWAVEVGAGDSEPDVEVAVDDGALPGPEVDAAIKTGQRIRAKDEGAKGRR